MSEDRTQRFDGVCILKNDCTETLLMFAAALWLNQASTNQTLHNHFHANKLQTTKRVLTGHSAITTLK